MAFHLIFPSRRHFWLPLCSNLKTKTSTGRPKCFDEIVESHEQRWPLFTGAGNATINYFNVFRKASITVVDAMNLKPRRCARVVETGTTPIIEWSALVWNKAPLAPKTKSFHSKPLTKASGNALGLMKSQVLFGNFVEIFVLVSPDSSDLTAALAHDSQKPILTAFDGIDP